MQLAVADEEHITLPVILVNSFARYSENIGVFGGGDGDADIHVGNEPPIAVVNLAGDLADITGSPHLDLAGNLRHGPLPAASRHGIPGYGYLFSGRQISQVSFV